MLRWILEKLRRNRRQIFRYHDGRRWRSADPMDLQEAVFSHPLFDQAKLQICDKPDKFGRQAADQILQVIRDAFQMPPYRDGKGSTQDECWRVWVRFVIYLEALKKNGDALPSSSEPMGSPAGFPTSNGVGSGSTSTESTPSAPTPSQMPS